MMQLTLAICVFNAERYIAETLRSVLSQSFKDFHLLIVDDCSSDSSVEIIQEFFKSNPRQYELICFDKNQGICHARRFAERYAKTPFMMFLDADDILLPEAIEKMWRKIQSDSDIIAVGCYLDYIDCKGKKLGGGLYLGETTKEGFIAKANAGKLIFMQPTAIYNRDASLKVGGYVTEGFPAGTPRYQDFCEDLDLWTRMSDLYVDGKAIIVLPETLALYRKGGGLSSNSLYMILKMRYTKHNVKARRNGLSEKIFTEFLAEIPEREMRMLRKEAYVADSLRNGAILLKRGNIVKGGFLILKSIIANPAYVLDKIKHNL
ncbi:MAG: glycosyltransferase family 2 protein [Duncaniella sp.]|nr:glycosyltransferase family 2 protein [Duncaniella sp.]